MALSAQVAEAVRRAAERELTPAEREAWLAPPTTDEREELLALRRWFCRRYPTPLERLAYVRRAVARWRNTAGAGSRPPCAGGGQAA